jgi:DNA-directed RNA polymerase sigma subunit (sigma70/sigma32)
MQAGLRERIRQIEAKAIGKRKRSTTGSSKIRADSDQR